MSPFLVFFLIGGYFGVLLLIAWLTSRKADTETFFIANRRSPWYLVAFAMIGTTISGVTFISVPGEVGNSGFSYLEFVMGNVVGYWLIAGFLLPTTWAAPPGSHLDLVIPLPAAGYNGRSCARWCLH